MKNRNYFTAWGAKCASTLLFLLFIAEVDIATPTPVPTNADYSQSLEELHTTENTSISMNENAYDGSKEMQYTTSTEANVYEDNTKIIVSSAGFDTPASKNVTIHTEKFSESTSTPISVQHQKSFSNATIFTTGQRYTKTSETTYLSAEPVLITSTEPSAFRTDESIMAHSMITKMSRSSPISSIRANIETTTKQLSSDRHITTKFSSPVSANPSVITNDELQTVTQTRRRMITSEPSKSTTLTTPIGITKLFSRKTAGSLATMKSDQLPSSTESSGESTPLVVSPNRLSKPVASQTEPSTPVLSQTESSTPVVIQTEPSTLVSQTETSTPVVVSPNRVSSSTIVSGRVPSSTATSSSTMPAATEDRYFVVIKSDDCPTLKANKFDRELSKALSALGVLNVTADISQTECQTKLNVNITATAPYSAIKLLEDSKKHNLTITIFNRTFKVVDIQRLDHSSKLSTSGSTPNVVNAVTNQEFNTYIAVGVCFGVVFIVCLSVCCIKCWINGPSKKLRALRRTHTPLSPEDYTLTPLPRPTSLYVDYCRNSFTGDVCSTTSAGSVASTSPIVEKGVVQPFETCIVPLEDTAIPNLASARRDSVESARARDNMSPNIHTVSGQSVSPDIPNPGDVFNTRPYVCSYQRPGISSNPSYRRY